MEIAYSKSINAAKLRKVVEVAQRLKVSPSWLMIVMYKETGGTFSTGIKNPQSSATGLIQFISKTAERLGTTTAKLSQMSFIQQMDYVEKYFLMVMRDKKLKGFNSFYDLYFAVFFPEAIGKADGWKFPAKIYKPNAGIDTNKNGEITVGEFKKWASIGHEEYIKQPFQVDLLAPLGAALGIFLLIVLFVGIK